MSKLSARDFKNFTEMVAWQEIVATVKERLNMIRNDLELGYEDVPTKDGTDRRSWVWKILSLCKVKPLH